MPRNRKQAYNMKQMNAGVSQESQYKDVLGSLLTMTNDEKWSNSQHTFIRSIQAPKPSISGIGNDNAVPESQSILHLRIGIKCINRRSYF